MSDDEGLVTLFRAAVVVCAIVAVFGVTSPELLKSASETLMNGVLQSLDWFFMAGTTGFLILCIWLAVSEYGEIKLGKPDDEPEFATASWLAMLFSAGMGSGLLFWGVVEPMTYFTNPPLADPESNEAARQALVYTIFHWGLHAWGVYGIAAMVLAYFGFRHDAPNLPGSPIRYAFDGSWVAPVATIANFTAVLAVVFGVAGAIGMGTLQVHTGLHIAAGVPEDSQLVKVLLIVGLVVCYMLSAATSLDKGIKWLSNINMGLVVLMLLFMLLAGATPFLMRTFATAVGDYATSLVNLSFRVYPYADVQSWFHGWTLSYFIWWIAWAPFVGVFVARISRGRTIREFVAGVLLAPTGFSMLWFAVFGGTGFHMEMEGTGGVARMVNSDMTEALFYVFDKMPLSAVLSVVTVFLVFVFLVTSADSATFVLSMMTSGGSNNPPTRRKLAWGTVLGAMSAALLLTDNVQVMRAVITAGAFPFTLIMLLQITAFIRQLFQDTHEEVPDDTKGGPS